MEAMKIRAMSLKSLCFIALFVLIGGCSAGNDESPGAPSIVDSEDSDEGIEDGSYGDLEVDVLDETTVRLAWSFDSNPDSFFIAWVREDGEIFYVKQVLGSARITETDYRPCTDFSRFQVTAKIADKEVPVARSAPVDVCNMVHVPAGPTWVGCDPKIDSMCYADEMPIHRVHLSAYWMDRTEVSFEKYRECVSAGVCRRAAIDPEEMGLSGDVAVLGVNWPMADAYCRWRGKRLPTEAQWEKAGRGDSRNIYPWGDAWEPAWANWDDDGLYDGFSSPSPVTAFDDTPSPYGILNLTGNVWEWVSDYYDPDYYSQSPENDPLGAKEGSLRIVKGGAWRHDFYETMLRLSHRNAESPAGVSDHVGFRCARN